jgi:hypothetical protein
MHPILRGHRKMTFNLHLNVVRKKNFVCVPLNFESQHVEYLRPISQIRRKSFFDLIDSQRQPLFILITIVYCLNSKVFLKIPCLLIIVKYFEANQFANKLW